MIHQIRAIAKIAFLLAFILVLSISNASVSSRIGVNYGRIGDNLPSFNQSIQLIQDMKADGIKIYDANPDILRLLSDTKLRVSIMIRNDEITQIALNQTIANQWVNENVLAFYPKTMIRYILVGNEVLSNNDTQLWYNLVPAMKNIHNSIRAAKIENIKIGTPLAMDIMNSTFPPSSGQFRPEILDHQVIYSLLNFLNETKSFFFLDVYPYLAWSANPTQLSLDYALLRNVNTSRTDPGSGLVYSNLLDPLLDSVIFAMRKLGFHYIKLAIAETGWPHEGDVDQPAANVYNAAIYNRNLIRKIRAKPAIGTPAQPNVVIPTFIFSLYDENKKEGPGTERHWGLIYSNATSVYDIDFTGKRHDDTYSPLPQPSNNIPFKGNVWCVLVKGVNKTDARRALESTCHLDSEVCSALSPGSPCYRPASVFAHANYAFSTYWAKYRTNGASCNFRGLATQTTTDPSHGACKFPSVTLQ